MDQKLAEINEMIEGHKDQHEQHSDNYSSL